MADIDFQSFTILINLHGNTMNLLDFNWLAFFSAWRDGDSSRLGVHGRCLSGEQGTFIS